MLYLRWPLFGVMVSTFLVLGVAMANRASQPRIANDSTSCSPKGTSRTPTKVTGASPSTQDRADRVGTDLRRAIQCLQLGRIDEATPSARLSSRPTRGTGDCSRRRPKATSTTRNTSASSSRTSSIAAGIRAVADTSAAYERDRSRALQLLVQGLDRARSDPDRGAAGRYLLTLAHAFMGNRAESNSWRLQSLTPLDVLPDYEEGPYGHSGAASNRGTRRARRDARLLPSPGEALPRPGTTAERWRWALAQAVEADPGLLNTARSTLAGFWLGQFGTQTIIGRTFRRTRRRPSRSLRPLCARHPHG